MNKLYKINNILIISSIIVFLIALIVVINKTNINEIGEADDISVKVNDSINIVNNDSLKKINDSINRITISKLKPLFEVSKDEFDPNGLTWCKPKNASKYVNENSIYCYFQLNNDKASNFRFRLQYLNEDWLFIQKVQFSIDGKPYEFFPSDVQSDNDTEIWEWFDENIDVFNEPLIEAIANAKSVKVKLIGRQYFDTKTMSNSQIKSIKNTLELYRAMGGAFN
ncbi:hypothetical protein ACTS9T_12630 [Empedobacter falsenii]